VTNAVTEPVGEPATSSATDLRRAVASPAIGVNLYPWDAVGDPAGPDRIAGLGATRVALAAAYHSVRALTPHHPGHKVVTASHSAVYFAPDPDRWRGRRLQPAVATWAPGSFSEGARSLAASGLEVLAWTVVAHNQRLGTLAPDCAISNAYGDSYPWALCIANADVQEYGATLAADAAAQPDIAGLELESCGWYGYGHLHAHDKTSAVDLSAAARFLMSLCFCCSCATAYRAEGLDPDHLRSAVTAALDRVFAGATATATGDVALASDLQAAVAAMRIRTATAFRAGVLRAVRTENPDLPVSMHTLPDPLAYGANTGARPADVFVEQVVPVLPSNLPSEANLAGVRAFAATGSPVVSTVTAVAGMGADLSGLPKWCADLVEAGATELRFYHAGLGSAADLAAMRESVRGLVECLPDLA
jgi:hypothetical protein